MLFLCENLLKGGVVTIENKAQETEKQLGRQTPTCSRILPYVKTLGGEAVEMYNNSGRTAMQWQELLIYGRQRLSFT